MALVADATVLSNPIVRAYNTSEFFVGERLMNGIKSFLLVVAMFVEMLAVSVIAMDDADTPEGRTPR